MPNVAIDPLRCEGARACVRVCPEAVFDTRVVSADLPLLVRWKVALHGGQQAVVLRPDACTGCMRCLEVCPEHAIKVSP